VYVGSWRLNVLESSGALAWAYTTGGIIDSSPALGSDGRVYVGSYDRSLYAFESSGAFRWSYATGDRVYSSPAIGSGGGVYVGSCCLDRRLYAFESSGALRWSYETGDGVFSSPALGSGERVYVGSHDNRLYAFESSGAFRWSYEGKSATQSSPAIGSDGMVYVGNRDHRVYAIQSNGALGWSYVTGCMVDSSPAIGSDGRVYVGSYDNKVYAIGPPVLVMLNRASFRAGELFQATFQLNESITQNFTAYAVVILPDGSMLNALSLDRPVRPVATDVPGLSAPFTYLMINRYIPDGAPAGDYEVVVAFFDPEQPIRSRADALLETSIPFAIQ
jgi:hypothetical protein